MTLPIVLTIAGCAALLVGLFGGGVKAKEIEVPKISFLPRIVSSLTGLALIGTAIWMSPIPSTEVSPTAVWLRSQSFAGQWYWNGSPGPVIYVNSDSLRIDMSAYGRTSATGRILDESTIEVTLVYNESIQYRSIL